MNESEVAIRNGDEVITVNVDNVPEIIASQIDSITALEEKVKTSDTSAKKAMDYVDDQMKRYEEKGKWIFKHRSGNTKEIIEDTQEAIEKLAEAQQVTVDALKQSFEFQRKLAEASKYLFDLGCANITVNRIAVRAIEAKLSGASKEKISDLARQEMMAVVKQLKEQEDILKKQEFLNSKVKEHAIRLDSKDDIDKKQSSKIESLDAAHKQDHSKISEIIDTLSDKDRIDTEQTNRLEELMAHLQNKEIIDKKQESSIEENRHSIEENSKIIETIIEYTKQKDVLDKEQSKEIIALKKSFQSKLIIILIMISSLSFIFSIIAIILQITQ